MNRRHFLFTGFGAAASAVFAACKSKVDVGDTTRVTTLTTDAGTPTTIASAITADDTTTSALIETTAPVPTDLDGLAATLRGRLLRPGEGDYEAARLLQCTMFDGIMPAAVARVVSADDIGKVIAYARANGVRFAVRSGGHSYAGWSSSDGLVIDMRDLAFVTSAAADGTVIIGSGTQLVDVYSALGAQGLAVAGGSCPTVGFGGSALGGGHGLTSRAYGLTCDAVTAIEIVTADGAVHQCNATDDPDLFWACRGGGGSFGVVTAFTVQPHPLPPDATTFTLRFPWNRAASALATWAQLVPSLPRETMTAARLEDRATRQLVVLGLHLGTPAQTDQLLAPLLGQASSTDITRRDFVDALMLEAGCAHLSVESCHTEGIDDGGTRPRQTPFAASSHYMSALVSAEAIAAAMAAVSARPADADACNVQFDAYGGAIADQASDATAFVHRNAFCSAQYSIYYDSGDGSASRSWVRETHEAMAPFSNGESYQNYVDADLDDWAPAYYGSNLARLQSVKRAVDPDNVFTFPQSIPL